MNTTMLTPAAGDLVAFCTHPRAEHRHGTHVAYVHDRCRCPACRAATAAYERHRHRQRAYGRASLVDAEPARAHVRTLMSEGLGLKQIARRASLGTTTVAHLIYGSPWKGRAPAARIRPATETALLGVRSTRLAAGALTDATGTHRRLQALVATGWSLAELARRTGIHPTNLPTVLNRSQVQVRTRDLIAALYEQLAYATPPQGDRAQKHSVSRARNHAAARGWHGPPAWFLVDIDDPSAVADLDGIRRPGRRHGDNDGLVEDLEWILRTGGTWEAAQQRTGMKSAALEQHLRRNAGRGDLITALKTAALQGAGAVRVLDQLAGTGIQTRSPAGTAPAPDGGGVLREDGSIVDADPS